MANRLGWCALVLALLGTGCDTIDRTQIRINPRPGLGTAAATAPEREAIKAALHPFASRLKLRDMTAQSLVPNVIVQYQQMDTSTPMKLVAWESNGAVLVDLFDEKAEPGESLTYQRARDELIALLRMHFGEQVSLVPFRQEAEQRRRVQPEP